MGRLTPEERLLKILRYRAKRQMRNFNRTIKYQCRKSLADTRPRVRGRFARDNEPGSVLPHETKKAIREKVTGPNSANSPPQPSADQLRAGSASPVLKTEPGQPLPAGPVEGLGVVAGHGMEATMPSAPPRGPSGLLEQHATLAQLYNQWSETGAAAAQQQQAQDASGQSQEARPLLPCSSNSA